MFLIYSYSFLAFLFSKRNILNSISHYSHFSRTKRIFLLAQKEKLLRSLGMSFNQNAQKRVSSKLSSAMEIGAGAAKSTGIQYPEPSSRNLPTLSQTANNTEVWYMSHEEVQSKEKPEAFAKKCKSLKLLP